MGVAGVIWVPSESNIGEYPSEYGAELEIYAKSLTSTYDQKRVPFYYAQPTASLVEGITIPKLPGAKMVTLDQWPKSLKEIAILIGKLAK
jgi:hypothetical protein